MMAMIKRLDLAGIRHYHRVGADDNDNVLDIEGNDDDGMMVRIIGSSCSS